MVNKKVNTIDDDNMEFANLYTQVGDYKKTGNVVHSKLMNMSAEFAMVKLWHNLFITFRNVCQVLA